MRDPVNIFPSELDVLWMEVQTERQQHIYKSIYVISRKMTLLV